MKKTLKKTLTLALAILTVFALSLTAFAADITADQAKEIALQNAGYSAEQVVGLIAYPDYENGVKIYDVNFTVKNADGSYLEFDYDIAAADGKIVKKETDIERLPIPSDSEADIGVDAAKQIAVSAFGFGIGDVQFIEARREYDDGVLIYDIDFRKDYDAKYSVEIVAADGRVIDKDEDISRNIFDKIELFFEVLLAQIAQMFSGK